MRRTQTVTDVEISITVQQLTFLTHPVWWHTAANLHPITTQHLKSLCCHNTTTPPMLCCELAAVWHHIIHPSIFDQRCFDHARLASHGVFLPVCTWLFSDPERPYIEHSACAVSVVFIFARSWICAGFCSKMCFIVRILDAEFFDNVASQSSAYV